MKIFINWAKSFFNKDNEIPKGFYSKFQLDEKDINAEKYKQYMGGKAKEWDKRGQFQLAFMKSKGLEKSSRFLDVGCGPLRAGVWFIEYLETGNYHGMDYNKTFIQAAKHIIKNKNLTSKRPSLIVDERFRLPEFYNMDFVLVFSVLNHCNKIQRKCFFQNISKVLKPDGKIYITHAKWFDSFYINNTGLILKEKISGFENLNPEDYGWPKGKSPTPILEFTRL